MRVPRGVVTTFISVFVLIVMLVGAGVAYTWYVGTYDQPVTAETPPVEAPPVRQPIQPRKPAPDARIGVAVQSITSPVQPGSNASLTVRTLPTADCTIAVTYNNVASKDSGLSPKKADEYGLVTWAWTVEESVPFGKWPAKVTCVFNERSAVVVGDLLVAKQLN